MGLSGLIEDLRADMGRYTSKGVNPLRVIITSQGMWATIAHRITHHAMDATSGKTREAIRIAAFGVRKMLEIVAGISIGFEAEIGPGLYIGHFGGVILDPRCKIGKNCSMGPGVRIGAKGRGDKGIPVIGDNVYIGTGSILLGDITIGDNAAIGANSVVTRDVAPGTIVAGVPAKLVGKVEQD